MSYTVTKIPRSLVFTGLPAVSEQLQMSYKGLQNRLQTNDFSKIVHVQNRILKVRMV